jgi:hypothetical protein
MTKEVRIVSCAVVPLLNHDPEKRSVRSEDHALQTNVSRANQILRSVKPRDELAGIG